MMLFLKTATTIMGSVLLLIGILSILLAIAAIRTHRSAETKVLGCIGCIGLFFGDLAFYPFNKLFNKLLVFTNRDWTILVILVVALIVGLIIDWVVLKPDK